MGWWAARKIEIAGLGPGFSWLATEPEPGRDLESPANRPGTWPSTPSRGKELGRKTWLPLAYLALHSTKLYGDPGGRHA